MINVMQDPAATGNEEAAIQSSETFLFLNLPEAWVIGLVILPLTVLFAWWCYGGLVRLPPNTRITLAALRGIAIALVLAMIFQPAWERVRFTEVQSQVHVLIDDSASMQRKDTYPDQSDREALQEASGVPDLSAASRTELVSRVLEKEGGLLAGLRETFDVRLYRFVRKPLPIRELSELTSTGNRTHIGDALDLHLASASTVNLDSVILVSDGRSNAGALPADIAAKYRLNDTPIYTVGVGDPNAPRNIRLIGPPGPQEALRREELAFAVTLDAEGLEGREVTVTMNGSLDGGPPRLLASQSTRLLGDHEPAKVRLYHQFEEAGDWVLKFEVTQLPEETSFEDNVATRFLRVQDQKIRVLYVDNLPTWQYRYLKNALDRVDKSIEYQAFMCDASRSFVQEHSPDLPALRGIPRTREQLQQYHVILLGDVPPERLAPTPEEANAWLELLVEWVEFGGGVGFMSGPIAMPESYRGSPLEDLLPVLLEEPSDLRRALPMPDRDEDFHIRLENPARPHDIVLLKRDPLNNTEFWHNGIAPFSWYYPVQQAKPGALVLMRHESAEHPRYGNRVVAATSFYPRGNTLFLATDEIWRLRNPYGEKFHDGFWRNVVRHLATGRLKRRDDRIELAVDRTTVETGGQVGARVTVLDEEFQPALLDQFAVFLRKADGEPERRLLRPKTGEPGTYVGRLSLDDPGSYSVMVFEGDNPGAKVLAREDIEVKIPDREMAESSQDQATLNEIAQRSKDGRYVFLADTGDLLEELGDRRTFDTEVDRTTRPIWDSFWSLAALLGVLAAEWILRKRARLV